MFFKWHLSSARSSSGLLSVELNPRPIYLSIGGLYRASDNSPRTAGSRRPSSSFWCALNSDARYLLSWLSHHLLTLVCLHSGPGGSSQAGARPALPGPAGWLAGVRAERAQWRRLGLHLTVGVVAVLLKTTIEPLAITCVTRVRLENLSAARSRSAACVCVCVCVRARVRARSSNKCLARSRLGFRVRANYHNDSIKYSRVAALKVSQICAHPRIELRHLSVSAQFELALVVADQLAFGMFILTHTNLLFRDKESRHGRSQTHKGSVLLFR